MEKYKIVVSYNQSNYIWDDIKLEYEYNLFLSFHNTITNDNGNIKGLTDIYNILTDYYDTKKEELAEYKRALQLIKELEKKHNIFKVYIYTHSDSSITNWELADLYNNYKDMSIEDTTKDLEGLLDSVVITPKDIDNLNYFKDVFNGEVYDIQLFKMNTCKYCNHTEKEYIVSSDVVGGERKDIIAEAKNLLADYGVKEDQLEEPLEDFEIVF